MPNPAFIIRPATAAASAGLCLLLVTFAWFAHRPPPTARPNVLMITIDDLNDWVGPLGGNPQARTPNIDRLAARGVTFRHAYTTSPVCNPSRTAVLSGLRPSTSGVYENGTDWRQALPNPAAMLPAYFRAKGYYVASAGKIYHREFPRDSDWDLAVDPGRVDPRPKAVTDINGIRFGPLDEGDESMSDYAVVDSCIEQLSQAHDRPFLLACGLHSPHLPWYVPKKYFDQFDLDRIVLPKVLERDLEDVPPAGVNMADPLGDDRAMRASGLRKDAVQGYLAAMAFNDAMVGRLIDALDRSAFRNNTIVVLWSDHGWHFGEKRHWRKNDLWEEATRVPLIFVAPGVTPAGGVSDRAVDTLSIYPTLTELCGLATPEHVEGKSVRVLLADPKADWRQPALTTYLYKNHTVRTERWRYILYADASEELYDHAEDPREWTNLAGDARFDSVKAEMRRWLPRSNASPLPSQGRLSDDRD